MMYHLYVSESTADAIPSAWCDFTVPHKELHMSWRKLVEKVGLSELALCLQ